jgi:uncharacterized protein YdaU (DUF1376 family)
MNGLPYYKAYPRDFIEGTIGMPFELKGAYRLVLDLIYMQGGKLPDDARYIAGLLGCSVRAWKGYREALLSAGKLYADRGIISNFRADKELEILGSFQDKQRQNRAAASKNNDLPATVVAPPRVNTEPDNRREGKPSLSCSKPQGLPFDAFWAVWPNKSGKEPARKAWAKLTDDERRDAQSFAANWFARWRERYPTASPILPGSYLTQRRWTDEQTPDQTTQPIKAGGRNDGWTSGWRGILSDARMADGAGDGPAFALLPGGRRS